MKCINIKKLFFISQFALVSIDHLSFNSKLVDLRNFSSWNIIVSKNLEHMRGPFCQEFYRVLEQFIVNYVLDFKENL